MHEWYAVAHPGLEPVVAQELADLGFDPTVEPGGVSFNAPISAAPIASQLRTPSRLLMVVVKGKARSYEELAALARRAPWSELLHPRAELEIGHSATASKLHHREAVKKKLANAIHDAQRKTPMAPGARKPPTIAQRVSLRLVDDKATISIDAGGELLHRRGWRTEAGGAPIRENLAACLLGAAGWSPEEPLVDPFCGSGTFLIEAALKAAGRSPHVGRTLAWQEWIAFAQKSPPAPTPQPSSHAPVLLGADRDPRALERARANARRAGVQAMWREQEVSALTPPPGPPGLIIANPPYGKRLGRQVTGVYGAFGHTLRTTFEGWRALFLAPNADLAHKVHRGAYQLTRFSNGGLKVGVWVVDG